MFKITPNWSAADDLLHDLARVQAVLDHFEFAREKDDITEYLALCPAHDDHNPSLVVFHDPRNKARPIRFFCRAGCAEEDVIHLLRERERAQALQDSATEDHESMTPSFTPFISGAPPARPASWIETLQHSPLAQLATYCGVSYSWLKDNPHLTLAEDVTTGWVFFVFDGAEGERPGPVLKGRKMPPAGGDKEKEICWLNSRSPVAPFYPIPATELPEEFVSTEGETDCILMRYWGFDAYALTAGAKTPLNEAIVRELYARGVRRWLICADLDPTGQASQNNIVHLCLEAGITPIPIDLRRLCDPLIGGKKDVRDLRHSFASPEEAHAAIRTAIKQSEEHLDSIIPAFEDAYAQRLPDPGWLAEDWTAAGVLTLLVGKPGLGKSSILLGYAKAARDGTPLLGKNVCKHSILLCTEEGVRSLWKKRELTGPLHNLRLHSVDFGGLEDDWAEQVRIVGDVARRHKIDVIIFDTLWSHAQIEDEDKSSKVRPIFKKLRALTRAGHSVLVTVHGRKSGGTGGDQIAGSVAIPGEVDIAVEILPSPDGEMRNRQISWIKSRLNSDIIGTPPMTITIDGADLVIVDDGTGAQAQEKKIKEFLQDGQWRTTVEIGNHIGVTQDALRRPLDLLQRQGIIEKEKCDGTNGKKGTYRFRRPTPLDLSGLNVH